MYIDMGHMIKVENNASNMSYYMPHHGVLKESSTTTKFRVVFDVSCRSSTVSLNEIQHTGPVLQPDLYITLIRFRQYNFVVVGDIEKMYRMCLLNQEQTALQRILWRESPNKPIDTYELLTTYGTMAASYLAIRCLN